MEIARPNEIEFKRFLYEEAEKHGVGWHTIWNRVEAGRYPGLVRRSVTRSRNFIQLPSPELVTKLSVRWQPHNRVSHIAINAIPYRKWLQAQARRRKTSVQTIHARVARGKYPKLQRLYVGTNKRCNYVRLRTVK